MVLAALGSIAVARADDGSVETVGGAVRLMRDQGSYSVRPSWSASLGRRAFRYTLSTGAAGMAPL